MNQKIYGRGGGTGRGGTPSGTRTYGRSDERDQSPTIELAAIKFGAPISPRLYSDIAEEAAKTVAAGAGRDRNKPSQLRRFYDELVLLQEKVGGDPTRFEQHQPFIQMLKAKVAYARGRSKVDVNFDALLCHVIEQAESAESLRRAKLFMEAFMGFYKLHGPKD